jgi:PIN domain nuclease of toxin-antitoxin system
MIGRRGILRLLLDTHVVVWLLAAETHLSQRAREAVVEPGAELLVSAVTAWEYADLHYRKRLPAGADFATAVDVLELATTPFPPDAWRLAEALPYVHGDPVDRMLIAHALHLDATLVTADATMRRYPVRSLW